MNRPRIIVGIDGSPGARHALDWAARWAARVGGEVVVTMGWTYPTLAVLPAPLGLPLPPVEEMDRATREVLDVAVEHARGIAEVPVSGEVRQGGGAEVLLDAAPGADLVVVGTRGTGRVSSVVLGSVSQRLVASAPCPVAVVPPDADLDVQDPVVVGVDGSPASLAALRWAAAVPGARVRAVHAFDHPFGGADIGLPGWDNPLDIGARLLEWSVAEALGEDADVEVEVVEGDPREVLVDPRRAGALVVLGAVGTTRLKALVAGSVASGVAAGSPVPVVVVRPPQG